MPISVGWPGKQLVLRDIKVSDDSTITMLGMPGTLKKSISGNTLTITTPDLAPDAAPCLYAYTFKITGAKMQPR